jgi:hypothetical protein
MLITVVNITYVGLSNSLLDHPLFKSTVAFLQKVSSSALLKKLPGVFASVHESLIVRHRPIGQINYNCAACCSVLDAICRCLCSVCFACSICIVIIMLTILLYLWSHVHLNVGLYLLYLQTVIYTSTDSVICRQMALVWSLSLSIWNVEEFSFQVTRECWWNKKWQPSNNRTVTVWLHHLIAMQGSQHFVFFTIVVFMIKCKFCVLSDIVFCY